MTHIEVSTKDLLDHVRELQRRSDILDAVIERADRGLAFALDQLDHFTESDQWSRPWEYKRDAYAAILEAAFGLPEGSAVDVPASDK